MLQASKIFFAYLLLLLTLGILMTTVRTLVFKLRVVVKMQIRLLMKNHYS